MHEQHYEQLVANIYNAGAGRMSWPAAFAPLMTAFDLWGIQLLGVDKRAGTLLFSYDTGNNSPAFLDYLRSYHRVNPRILPSLTLKANEWMHDHEHFDDAYVAHSSFYQDFVIPHGSRYLSGTKIIEDSHTLVLFGAMRGLGKPPLGVGEIDLLNRMKRHLVEAMKIYLHLRKASCELSAGQQLLQQFSYPMLLVDEQRGIRFRNKAAEEMLKATDFMVERNACVACRDPESDRGLTLAIRALNLSGGEPLGAGIRRQRLRIKNARGTPLVVFATALRPAASMEAFGTIALALLVLHDPTRKCALDPFILAEVFDLTPAEAKVCAALVSGLTPAAIAKAHHVALSTVRSQIKASYAKTGTRRQSELVRALTNLSEFETTPG